MIQRCWRLYEFYGQSDMSRNNRLLVVSGALDLDMVLHCKWFMLLMTLDMPDSDEGTR